MRRKNIIILTLLLLVCPLYVMAQEARISGTISDAMGPIMMCNVVEVDANNRNISFAQTDMNGNFSMAVKNTKNKLKISYVGYKTVTLAIGTRTRFDVTLQDATADECRALILKNGEHMPELKDMLALLKKSTTSTKLIIEIKECRTLQQNLESARQIVKAVRKAGMQKKVEYISFSLAVCVEIARLDPTARVAFLSGWITPKELHKLGITGLDYHLFVFQEHPEWVKEAHELGMYTNVWTIDSDERFREFRDMGIDYITTNNPEGAVNVVSQ